MNPNPDRNHRILVIDDNQAIHGDFQKILSQTKGAGSGLAEAEAALFGEEETKNELPEFQIDSALQGREGLNLIEKSLLEGYPYSMAFVDVRASKLPQRSGKNILTCKSSSARPIPTIRGKKC
jgi:hypothetical protein